MSSSSSVGSSSQESIPHPHNIQSIPGSGSGAAKIAKAKASKIEALMKRSFGQRFGDYNPYSPLESEKVKPVIGILGTSTAGKSSIIAALKAMEPDLVEQGIDLACEQVIMNYLELAHPEEINFLNSVLEKKPQNNQIFESLVKKKFNFKEGVSEEDKIKAKVAIDLLDKAVEKGDRSGDISTEKMELWMLEEVISSGLNNNLSIFDVVEIGALFDRAISNNLALPGASGKAYFKKIPLQIALVYCPFHLLTERLKERTRKAIESKQYIEMRIGTFPLFQYAHLFGPKKHPDDPVVETITRKMVEEAFSENYDAEIKVERENNPDALIGKDIEADKIKSQEKLLKAFGFNDPQINSLELTPRFKGYEWLIDTSKTTPEGAAELLQKG